MSNAHRSARLLKKDSNANKYWNYNVTQAEQEGREEKETIRVVDEELAKRRMEILYAGITIQDLASSEDVKGLDILHVSK